MRSWEIEPGASARPGSTGFCRHPELNTSGCAAEGCHTEKAHLVYIYKSGFLDLQQKRGTCIVPLILRPFLAFL